MGKDETKPVLLFLGGDPEIYYAYFNAVLRDSSMHELGVGTARDMKSVITGLFLPSLRCRAYSPMERIRIWQGKRFAQDTQPSF